MIDTQKIIALAEGRLEGTDMFVVSCTCSAGNDIELLIDSDTSVDIDTCAALNRAIEAELDRDNEDFSLTVASAGIGSELKQLRQYRKLIGCSVEVLLLNGTKILARLDAADQEGITISYEEKQAVEGKKRKQSVTVSRTYPSAKSNIRRSTSTSNSFKQRPLRLRQAGAARRDPQTENERNKNIERQWTISTLSATLPSSRS